MNLSQFSTALMYSAAFIYNCALKDRHIKLSFASYNAAPYASSFTLNTIRVEHSHERINCPFEIN